MAINALDLSSTNKELKFSLEPTMTLLNLRLQDRTINLFPWSHPNN
jgi:hypothetical protein